jgi:hypothetical protein
VDGLNQVVYVVGLISFLIAAQRNNKKKVFGCSFAKQAIIGDEFADIINVPQLYSFTKLQTLCDQLKIHIAIKGYEKN